MRILALILAMFGMLDLVQPLYAERGRSISASIDVAFSGKLATAIGLVLDEKGVYKRIPTKVEKKNDEVTTVTFSYADLDLSPGAVVSALLMAEDGTLAYGDVAPIADQQSVNSLTSLPKCPIDSELKEWQKEQYLSSLEKIVTFRIGRRQNTQALVARELDEAFLKRLTNLENGLGLARDKPLSADLAPYELVDRLSRLLEAVNTLKLRRQERIESSQANR
jgi:hypothetical protein